MSKTGTDLAPGSPDSGQWTLIRGARQLLTLRGASGPRRGSAMSDVSMIADGAVLIRDGFVHQVGTSRTVENLAQARHAHEIDAAGKVVMPAFVDSDTALATPVWAAPTENGHEETDIRRMSRRRLESQAMATAADLARYGVLTVGAHTLAAPDLQNTMKALRLHQAMQAKPLRIRSIVSPQHHDENIGVCRIWLAAIQKKNLASLLEIPVTSGTTRGARALTAEAATTGFGIRFRVAGPTAVDVLELAYSAGAVAIIGPIPESSDVTRALADLGCVSVVLASEVLAGNYGSKRSALDDGNSLALASGYQQNAITSLNPQFLLFLACHDLGFTIEEAIVATTYNAACSLRLSHVTGSIEQGKWADICVMDVDDYREMARLPGHNDVYIVVRAGRIVYRRPGLSLD